ncbi:glycoside hydrolase family 5 protein [Methylopila sp. M107]|uniref:glycoside hydrolase family 5 protein n=1 Tax=Methylopila sp. M107 TaxID=1101190 RepID=UPI0003A91913|nr:glycoside hydrolase family 5 protein [Methylopila sp. M107]
MTAITASVVQPALAEPCLRGVNISGAEFGQTPGRPNFDYAYPGADAFKRLAANGGTSVRLPFRWERLQPAPNKPFDKDELARLDGAVKDANEAGLIVVVDPHDYAYYKGKQVGSADVPVANFVDLWKRLAGHFKGNPRTVFSLMNEPYDVRAADWSKTAQAAVDAIRKSGALQLIIVPGTAYTGAHSWSSELAVGRNDVEMAKVSDPLNRMAYDFHQYLDGDFSGRTADCPGAERALKAIDDVTAWLKAGGRRGYLGEFAVSERPECVAAMKTMVTKMNDAPNAWIGWAAWGAGGWWPKDYVFNLEPTDAGERPQMAALKSLMAGNSACDLGSRP